MDGPISIQLYSVVHLLLWKYMKGLNKQKKRERKSNKFILQRRDVGILEACINWHSLAKEQETAAEMC